MGILFVVLPSGLIHSQDAYWSPNGMKIAYTSVEDGNSEVYIMDKDGKNKKRITFNLATDFSPTWSPDGSQLTFGRSPDGKWENFDLFIINIDGTGEKQLTESPGLDMRPIWLDKTTLLFNSDRNIAGHYEIFTLKIPTGEVTQLTNTPKNSDWPWPYESIIYFESDRSGSYEVYKMNSDGSDQTRITFNGGGAPSPSPDGKRIAFQSNSDGDWEIYVMNSDGTNIRQSTQNREVDDRMPSWSDDGLKLTFATNRTGRDEVFIMDVSGKNVKQLTGIKKN